jgi:hypothetical protein
MTPEHNPAMDFLGSLKSRALDVLPTAGGMAGGFLGMAVGAGAGGVGAIPGSVIGSGLGGAAGEGIKEAVGGHPLSPGGIAAAGGEQAAYDLLGHGIAQGAGAVARPIMRRALGAGKSILSKFPNVVETTLKEGLPISKGGLTKATDLLKKSIKATNDLLTKAKTGGKTFTASDVAARAYKTLSNEALPNEDAAVIARNLKSFLDQHSGEIDPLLLQDIKQLYQTRAIPMYSADAAGKMVSGLGPEGQFNKAIARGAREQLGTIPGVAAQDATTQSLIGAQRAIRDATMRVPKTRVNLMEPLTYPLLNLVDTPQAQSHLALLLNSAKFKALAKQSPRAAAALVQQLIHTDQPDSSDFLNQPIGAR